MHNGTYQYSHTTYIKAKLMQSAVYLHKPINSFQENEGFVKITTHLSHTGIVRVHVCAKFSIEFAI